MKIYKISQDIKNIELSSIDYSLYSAVIRRNPSAIRYIKNPSMEVQLEAVNENGYVIQYIQNPSIEVQLAAVRQSGDSIEFIQNPSLEVQIAAVMTNDTAINRINNPSEEVQMAAVKRNGLTICYIKNPTLEVQILALTGEKANIILKDIKNIDFYIPNRHPYFKNVSKDNIDSLIKEINYNPINKEKVQNSDDIVKKFIKDNNDPELGSLFSKSNNWYKVAIKGDIVKDVVAKWESRFSDIFGNNKRIVLPLENKWLADIRKKLENGETKSGTKYKISPDYSMAIMQKVKRDGSPDNRQVGLGRVIGSELGQEYMNEWARQWETIGKNKSENFSVVLSIDPIDIVRMSDHEGIESCHSEGGTFFNCAVEEAKSGGGVAYVVPTSELNKVNLNELSGGGKELFLDENRHTLDEHEGKITPISRIRINRYIQEDEGGEVAIPVNVHYGEYIPDFYSTVRDFLLEKQKDKIPELEDNLETYVRTGGSYVDKNDSAIIKECFGDDMGVRGNLVNKNSLDQQKDQWEREIETSMSNFNDKHDLAEVWGSVDINDDNLNAFGSFEVKFSIKMNFSDELEENEESILTEIDKLFNYRANNSMRRFASSDMEAEGEFKDGMYYLSLKGYFEDIYNPDSFDGACDNLNIWMKDEYGNCLQSMLNIFVKYGCYKVEHVAPNANGSLRSEVGGMLSGNGVLVYSGYKKEFSVLGEAEQSNLLGEFTKAFRNNLNKRDVNSGQMAFEFDAKLPVSIWTEEPLFEMRINKQKGFRSNFSRLFSTDYVYGEKVNIFIRVPVHYYHQYGHEYFLHISRIWDRIINDYRNAADLILRNKDSETEGRSQKVWSSSSGIKTTNWYGFLK